MRFILLLEKVYIKSSLWFSILAVILLGLSTYHAFKLRAIGNDRVPENYVILDERTWIWQGLSIRRTGVPAGWSNIESYKGGRGGTINGVNLAIPDPKKDIPPALGTYRAFPKPMYAALNLDFGNGKRYVPFVQPFLDNPPLGGLIMSAFLPGSVNTFTYLTPKQFRYPPLLLAVITTILIFILGWQVYRSPWVGLLGAVIYGSAPTFLLLSRYALLENVLAPLILSTLTLLILSFRVKSKKLSSVVLVLSAVFAGCCALVKETGWVMLPIGLFLIWQQKSSPTKMVVYGIISSVIGLLYFVWGYLLAPNFFPEILRYHASDRPFIGSINFLVTIWKVGITNFPLDGWWLGGFLALILNPFKKQQMILYAGEIGVLFSALFLGSANYPWYFIPLIPFMCLATGEFFWSILTHPSLKSVLIFFLIFFSSSFYWGYGVYRAALKSTLYHQPVQFYRVTLALFLLAAIYWQFYPRVNKFKVMWVFLIVSLGLWVLILNNRSFEYIIFHWGSYPPLFTPGTF